MIQDLLYPACHFKRKKVGVMRGDEFEMWDSGKQWGTGLSVWMCIEFTQAEAYGMSRRK